MVSLQHVLEINRGQKTDRDRGVINSFGVFQSFYVDYLGRTPSDISWIGSMEIFLLFFIGTFTGRLTDAGFFRSVSTIGSVLIVLGSLTASVSTKYWQVFLAQGVCVGLGNGCLFCPTLAIVATYFQKRRAFAIGLTACGTTTGGILYPLLMRQLLPRIGFGWSMRTMGFIQAATLIVAMVCIRTRVPPRRTGQLVEWAAFRELEYVFFALGSFIVRCPIPQTRSVFRPLIANFYGFRVSWASFSLSSLFQPMRVISRAWPMPTR